MTFQVGTEFDQYHEPSLIVNRRHWRERRWVHYPRQSAFPVDCYNNPMPKIGAFVLPSALTTGLHGAGRAARTPSISPSSKFMCTTKSPCIAAAVWSRTALNFPIRKSGYVSIAEMRSRGDFRVPLVGLISESVTLR